MAFPPVRRFQRIADDLEKLPCELHDDILKDLDFEQHIRLSRYGGERLAWSFSNSLAPWGKWFRNGAAAEWQKYLAVTDQVKRLCQKPTQEKNDETFYDRGFGFLHHRGADWDTLWSYANRHGLLNEGALARHWLYHLNQIVNETTSKALLLNYANNVEPWVKQLERTHGSDHTKSLHKMRARREGFIDGHTLVRDYVGDLDLSIDELASFMEVYQEVRLIRAQALAAELNRLADLYEKHPVLLKMPFAPQTYRPNPGHVLDRLRYDAIKVIRKVHTDYWRPRNACQSRFSRSFPALIPFEYCKLLAQKAETLDLPEDIMADYKVIREGPAQFEIPTRTVVDETDLLEKLRAEKVAATTDKRSTPTNLPYRPQDEVTLKWLESFCAVLAWMVDNYPDMVQQVRGDEWMNGRPRR